MSRLSRALRQRFKEPVLRYLRVPAEASHQETFKRLRSVGFSPRTIYDIGASTGHWTSTVAAPAFRGAEFVLFEANSDHSARLQELPHRHFIVALGDTDVSSKPFFIPHDGGHCTGASLYRQTSSRYLDRDSAVRAVNVRRLDTMVRENKLKLPDLVKIDVQGAELDVIRGGVETLSSSAAVLAETSLLPYNDGAPLFAEVVSAMERIGFRCVDLSSVGRSPQGFLFQIDLMFVRSPLFERFAEVGLPQYG